MRYGSSRSIPKLDQAGDLVVGQSEGGEPGDGLVDLLRLAPLVAQPVYRLQGQPRRLGNGLGFLGDHPVEVAAEPLGDQLRLDRTDPLDVGMIGQVVGKPLDIQLQVVFHGLDLELPAVLGMCDPASGEDHRLVLAGEQAASELDLVA
jgi:hypothetical protein